MEGIATETETACGNEAVVTKSASEPAAEKVEDVADSPGSNVVVVSGSQTGSSSYEESTEPLSSSSTVPDTTVADAGPFQRPSYVNRIHLTPPGSPRLSHEEHQQLVDEVYETGSSKESEYYDMALTKLALIFNHKQFDNTHRADECLERKGTEYDVKAIKGVFGKHLGFKVIEHHDLTVAGIRLAMAELQAMPDISCVAIFILTHGKVGGVLEAYDTPYSLQRDVISELLPYNCRNLAGKPKMIFVQACQGEETDSGVKVRSRNHSGVSSTDAGPTSLSDTYCIPNFADLLIYQASYYGHYSFRNQNEGSWFIQALCKTLEKSQAPDEIDVILKQTSRQIALNKASRTNKVHLNDKRQIPLVQSTLIRGVYLKRDWNKLENFEVVDSKERHSSVVGDDGGNSTKRTIKDGEPKRFSLQGSKDKCSIM